MDTSNFQIDTHVHILTDWRIQGLARWMKKAFPQHPVSVTATADDLVDDLKNGGTTHFFNLVYPLKADETDSLNAFNMEFCKRTPGAVPFAGIHQDTPDKAKLAEKLIVKDNMAGFKIHPFIQNMVPWDKKMEELYAFLQEAQKPVFFHTGFEEFYGKSLPVTKLHALLKKFPRLPVVFVHMSFPDLDYVFNMMEEFPGLYLDATGVFVYFRHSFKPYMPQALSNGMFERLLSEKLVTYKDRIFFGSDHPVGWGDINRVFKDLTFVPVSEDIQQSLRYEAAMAFIDKYYPGFNWGNHLQMEI